MEKWLITVSDHEVRFVEAECQRLGLRRSEVIRRMLDEQIKAESPRITITGSDTVLVDRSYEDKEQEDA